MPPDGYTTVTISDSLATKLTRITYAADTTLVQADKITTQELIQLLAERVDEAHETNLQ
jgi:hypothetical protein